MKPVYIFDAKRTPIGRFGGGLKALSAAELVHGLGEVGEPRPPRNLVEIGVDRRPAQS